MELYNYKSVDKLINEYIEKGGQSYQVSDGVLGSGDWILYGLYYSFIIKEVYVSHWSSGHSVRRYKKLPIKYKSIINNDQTA